ncbi:MAG: CvpA family protein [Acidobacteriota bacterium]|nr:CvpA family protein [Acidobacteriota bacterium]
MIFNWLDIILLVILVITLVLGIIKGLIKEIVGILAVILGFILALVYYPHVSEIYIRFISNRTLSQFLGFLTIFLIVLCVGWLISRLFSKLMKGPLRILNHVLGGGFGLVKGILICGILVFAMLVFSINILKESRLAPCCLKMTRLAVGLIPKELKEKFNDAYGEVVNRRGKHEKRI